MTPRQTALYFREWGYVRGYCKRHRLPEPDRHALHVQALGEDKSSKVFNNSDFDKVLAVFRAVHQPANVEAQIRQLDQPHRRKLGKIRELLKCLGLYVEDAPAYAREIVRDKINRGSQRTVSEIDELSDEPRFYTDSDGALIERPSELEQLMMTLERVVNGRHGFRATAGDTLHDMRTKAGLQCGCRECSARARARAHVLPEPALVGADNEPF